MTSFILGWKTEDVKRFSDERLQAIAKNILEDEEDGHGKRIADVVIDRTDISTIAKLREE